MNMILGYLVWNLVIIVAYTMEQIVLIHATFRRNESNT